MNHLIKLIAFLAVTASSVATADPFVLEYAARVTDNEGKPIDGTINVLVRFFDAHAAGNQLPAGPYAFATQPTEGVITLRLPMTPTERDAVFGSAGEVWIEIKNVDKNLLYPRQRFSAVPYAMRVPVDGMTIGYNASGELETLGGGGGSTITAVNAGTGLTGGGTTGAVTLNLDPAALTGLNASAVTSGQFASAQIPSLDAGKITTGVLGTARLPSASGVSAGILSAADYLAFGAKEAALPAGTNASQYLGGDKTWHLLDTDAVAEGSKKYFTDTLARAATISQSISNGITNHAPSEDAVYDALGTKQSTDTKNQANGYAGLDGTGKIDPNQMPFAGLSYQGLWNATTNVPTLTTGVCGTSGGYYIVGTAGNFTLDGITPWTLGDWVICSGTGAWQRVGSSTSGITTINGLSGSTVTLTTDEVGESATKKYLSAANDTKLGHLTVTQPVNLDTIESDTAANNAKISYPAGDSAKVGQLTVTQPVNLDTIESDTAANNAKNTYPAGDATKVGHLTVTQAVNLDTIESDTAANNAKNTYPAGDATKVGHLTVTQAVNLDTIESDTATNNAKNSYPTGDATKVGFVAVTQAVNLDTVESDAAAAKTKTDFLTVTQAVNLDQLESDVAAMSSPWTVSGADINRASGNVGVGVGSPTQKLDVNGTVKATGLALVTGAQAVEKVLVSDAAGSGNWQMPRHYGQTCADGKQVIGFDSLGNIVCSDSLSNAIQVVAGAWTTCALLQDKSVKCWGWNAYSQLGDGTTTNRYEPVQVYESSGAKLSNIKNISAGTHHFCAASYAGTVHCWGWNAYNQLGDTTATDRPYAVTVPGITTAIDTGAGKYHSCALLSNQTVKCWGLNDQGQLGNATTTSSTTPVTVSGITTATKLSVGARHNCVVLADATAKCWGHNEWGGLGDNTTTNRSTAVAVSGLTNVAQISAAESRYGSDENDHSCAVKTDGTLWCWGQNASGQLGDGTTTNRYTPVQAKYDDNEDGTCDGNMTGVAKVTTGAFATCVLTTTGTARCMGFNQRHVTTEATTADRRCLIRIRGINGSGYLSGLTDIELGQEWQGHVVALDSDGQVITWGDNEAGNLGYNSLTDRDVPAYAHGF